MLWLVFDLHGSVVALCPSGSSTLSDAYRFDGFGQQIASAGSATNPWRYRGLLNVGSDALTGALLDMVSRHYSPQLGVFTQQDSVQGSAANPMTMNRFLYALANPATLIDPDGHMALREGGGEGGALIETKPYVCSSSICDPNYRPSSTTTTTTKTIQSKTRAADCGFERLGCRSDVIAGVAGFSMGLGQSAWDIPAGLWDFGAGIIDDSFCSFDPVCGQTRAFAAQAREAAFWADWSDPFAAVRAGLNGAASGIGDLGNRIFNARSGFEGAREAGHVTGTAVSFAAAGLGVLRAARLASASRTGIGSATMPERLYINGSRTPNNLTPRAGDLDGLSSWDTLQRGVNAGRKGACIETCRLAEGGMIAVKTGPPGHWSIRPIASSGMGSWIESRIAGTFADNPFTRFLQSIAVEVWNR